MVFPWPVTPSTGATVLNPRLNREVLIVVFMADNFSHILPLLKYNDTIPYVTTLLFILFIIVIINIIIMIR